MKYEPERYINIINLMNKAKTSAEFSNYDKTILGEKQITVSAADREAFDKDAVDYLKLAKTEINELFADVIGDKEDKEEKEIL